MAEKSNWQNQNFSKSSGGSGPSSMNSKIATPSSSLHSKIAAPTNFCNGGSVKKFADGTPGGVGAQDDVTGVDAAVARNAEDKDWAASENYGDGTTAQQRREMTGGTAAPKEATADEVMAATKEASPAATGGKMSFGEAFKAARERGDKTFTWDGKPGTTFTTEMASSKGVSKAPAAKVEAAPAAKVNAAPAAKTEKSSTPAPSAVADSVVVDTKPAAPSKTFAEDVAERKRNAVANSMARDENYGHEGNRPLPAKTQPTKTGTYRGLDGKVRRYGE